ncbi:hypothetical protein V495_00307 [Pseudogymnoascus sp. VKM F-4514 (FW-929)]|nr:hypothetical protein V495_00307 [Pseudogymnoascus sp. VKM F-4514 (FW-929)]KFY66854.1 hypothetical protein V497_00637 [Pseudogymnoascus sp. VKM F-4516 (FW-969)]
MNQDSFRNPAEGYSQPWHLSEPMRMPALASADSQESFASQIPLPYHLPADHPDHEYISRPLTGQPWTYEDPKQSQAPRDIQNHRSGPFYGNQYGIPQNQNPYDFGNSEYQRPLGGYPHNVKPYNQNGWQNFPVTRPGPQYQQGFGPDRMMSPLGFHPHGPPHPGPYPMAYGPNGGNQNYSPGKPPVRRNGHRPRLSVASIKLPSQYNDNGNMQNGGYGQKRHVSSGAELSRQNHDGHDLAPEPEPFPWTTNPYQTPNGKITKACPTPKTARELGQETPTPLLRSRRNESVTDAAKSFKSEPMTEPPPSFSINGRRQSKTTDSSQVSPRTVPEKTVRHDSDAVDPFLTESNEVTLYGKKARFDAGTPSRAVMPLHVSLYQPAPGPSAHLAALCPNGAKPSVELAFDSANMPFVEPARTHPGHRTTGMVRISNIPFSCSRQEISAFLGRNAKLIPEAEEPIHIVMERVTSKTMDAFVEFVDINEAVNAVTRYEANRAGGRGGRLGERHVALEVCGHELFMQALFPKAVNVVWKGSDPQISTDHDRYNSGFKGFISREELVMLVKHVEAPQRSPFSTECPQRPFECLISSLIKYPWHKVHDITIGDRDALFQTAIALCKNIVERVDTGGQELAINDRLLKRVQRAVLNCCGFSESQKDDFAFIFRMTSLEAGLPPHADHWTVFKTIGAKRNWSHDVILYYIALLREATTSSALVSLAERSAKGLQTGALSAFGNVEIEYPKDISNMSLSAVGEIEWHAIEALLRKVLE